MRIAHVALGGCLRAPPVPYGLTADTGGHIAYVLSAATAQARRPDVEQVTIYTRAFDDHLLGSVHGRLVERLGPKVGIVRIPTRSRDYLEKEALARELPAFTAGFLDRLRHETRRPDVIHAHFADAAAVALAAREAYGPRVVYTPHALGLDKRGMGHAMGLRIAAERRAIAEADAIVVSSHDEALRQLGRYEAARADRRVHVVAPGVPECFGGRRLVGGLGFVDPGRPLVLAVARPVRKKNLVALAEAFAGSALRETANLAILAGQHDAPCLGAEEHATIAALRALARDPALAGTMALPPRHGCADVRALYRAAARSGGVFVNPALHEPFGLTLLEAADAGLPVVATAHGGAADIVDLVGHGVTVDPRDTGAIAAACLRIVSDRALHGRYARAAGDNLDRHFSWERYARRSVAIYAPAEAREATAA